MFGKIGEIFGIPRKPTPEEIARQAEAECRRREREEQRQRELEAARREELKREKIAQLKRVVHDARIFDIFDQSGMEYSPGKDGVYLHLPHGYRLWVRIKQHTPYVEAQHFVTVATMFRDILNKYSDLIKNKQLAIGIDAKLPKPLSCSRLVFSLPVRHTLVFVFESNEIKQWQPLVLDIVKDVTDAFVQLAQRLPKGTHVFALNAP